MLKPHTYLIVLLCFIGQFYSSSSYALDSKTIHFKHYNFEDGLISNWVNSIVQDEDGFMWFGTSEGLSRFDGYGFKNFTSTAGQEYSLNNNFIVSVANDTLNNCIWLVTATGVSKLNKSNFRFKNYPISDSLKVSISPFSRGSVVVDKEGTVWVEGFSEKYSEGLFKYIPETDNFENISLKHKNFPKGITYIYEDKSKRMWLATEKGLFRFLPKTETVKWVPFADKSIDSLNVTSVYEDKLGNLWVGTHHDHAIYRIENGRLNLFYKSEYSQDDFNWISAFASYDNETLLASVKDLGILALNINTKQSTLIQPDLFNTHGLKSKNPFTIYDDNVGNVWVGTYTSGVNFLDKHKKKFSLYQFNYTDSGLVSNNVRAFFEDSDGDLWVGTKQKGSISKFNPKTGTFKNYISDNNRKNWLDNDIVICINELERGKLLIGTYGGGIYLFDKKKETFTKFARLNERSNSISDKYIYSLYKDRDDRIWIGSNSSVDIYHTATGTFSHPKGVNYARCFLDNGVSILIGTWTKGLYLYDKTEKLIENYTFKHPTLAKDKDVRINGMAQDSEGFVWMATNRGLLRYKNKMDSELLLTTEDGLPDNDMCAVLIDNNDNVWASTMSGLVKYNTKTNIIKTYNKFDGLQSTVFEKFVSLKTKSGHMLFSGSNGFNMFHPDSIIDKTNSPKVYISDMRILNAPVQIGGENSPLKENISLTKKIVLSNIQSSFSFEFVTVNYTSPEKSKYLYKLEGHNVDWVKADEQRMANFTRVPAGNYTFMVKASNGDGVWSEEPTTIKVRIKPPFSRSYIAFIIYIILLIGFLAGFQLFVRHNTLQKNRLEEEMRENKRLDEINKNRIRFFTNISHELRTPLTLISSPLSRLSNYNTSDKQLSSLLHIMNRNSQRLLRIVNQLMDFRRIEENRIHLKVSKGDIIAYVKDILNSFNDIINNRSIKLNFKTNSVDGYTCWYDPSIIDKVLFNLLSNAVKFSKVNGEVQVEVNIENNEAIFIVSDNGIGIAKQDIDRIFDRFYTTDSADHKFAGAGVGLSFTKSLVELHKGKKEVKSILGEGSTFKIILPVGDKDYKESERMEIKEETIQPVVPIVVEKQMEDAEEPGKKPQKDIILVVEDYDDLREYLEHNLSTYEVLSCSNGKEALKITHEKMPDLILSDVMMPEMDGLELCKYVKTNIITSHIPVILLTARISAEQKMEGFAHHADAYIEKPFSIDLLEMQIANLLQLRKNISAKYNSEIVSQSVDDGLSPLDKKLLEKTNEIVNKGIDNPELSVESLSHELGMSRSQLFRKFKALTNSTPSQFIKIARLKKAAELLSEKEHNVNEVAFMVGFVDSSHFIASFKKFYRQTPKQFAEAKRT